MAQGSLVYYAYAEWGVSAKCRICDQDNPPEVSFCANCGTKLVAELEPISNRPWQQVCPDRDSTIAWAAPRGARTRIRARRIPPDYQTTHGSGVRSLPIGRGRQARNGAC